MFKMNTFEGDCNPEMKLRSGSTQQLVETKIDLKKDCKGNCSKEVEKTLALETTVYRLIKRTRILQSCINRKNERIDNFKEELDRIKAKQAEEVAFLKRENLDLEKKLCKAEGTLKWIDEDAKQLISNLPEELKLLCIANDAYL